MKIQENVLLAPYTTFKIGGNARFFTTVKSVEELEQAINFAKEGSDESKHLPIFVLGGGSNVLISDSGFNGLVIKNEIMGIVEEEVVEDEVHKECVRIIAGAGENWDDFVKFTVLEKGLYGLENLSAIPGTVGAAPVQNIGAYGAEVKNTIEWVEVYDPALRKIEKLANADCHFGYRDSIFKTERKNNIILRVSFVLSRAGKVFLEYKDLKVFFAGRADLPTLAEVRDAVLKVRAGKFPDLTKIGTAGSFFKNIVIPRSEYQALLKRFPTAPAFLADPSRKIQGTYEKQPDEPAVKVPTAWVLDKVCNFKGKRRGNVGLFENQALVMANYGGGTAREVKTFAEEIIFCVKQKTGLTIYPEVEFVG